MLSGLALMGQASRSDSQVFDLSPSVDDGPVPAEVDVGGGEVAEAFVVATVVDAQIFANGRSFAAWLGLTPRQHATGGRERLLGISKRGDGYLRRQLMHGARSLVRLAAGRTGRFWTWIDGLVARRPFNVVVAAVANKLARIIWAMLGRSETYRALA